MKIVIDIPDGMYDFLIEHTDRQFPYATEWVRQGTPLPKGHGRLIDADDLLAFYDIDGLDDATRGNINFFIECKGTIIEADKEENNA